MAPVILTTQTLITQLHAPNVLSAAFSFSSYLPLILSLQVGKKKNPNLHLCPRPIISSSMHCITPVCLPWPCRQVMQPAFRALPIARRHLTPAQHDAVVRHDRRGGRSAAVARAGGGAAWDGGGTKAGRVTGMYLVPQPIVRYRQASCLPRPRSDTTVPRRDSRLKKLPRRNSRVYSTSYKSRTQDLANKDH